MLLLLLLLLIQLMLLLSIDGGCSLFCLHRRLLCNLLFQPLCVCLTFFCRLPSDACRLCCVPYVWRRTHVVPSSMLTNCSRSLRLSLVMNLAVVRSLNEVSKRRKALSTATGAACIAQYIPCEAGAANECSTQ